MARIRLRADSSPQPSRAAMSASWSARRKMSAGPRTRPSAWNSRTVLSPSPSMSKAPRETKWISRSSVWAAQVRPPVQRRTTSPGGAHGKAAADRAVIRGDERLGTGGAALGHHRDDLRDHVAGALQHHGVADAHILAGDLVLVVQRRARDQHAADIDRRQPRHRGQRAGAADLDVDVFQHGGGLLGGEFPGDRPARLAADEAQPALQARSSIL